MKKYLYPALIAIITIIIFLPSQYHASFGDSDMFYHIKIAELISENGFLTSLPWLPFTSLAEFYTDHHFLYHIALIPFIKIAGPFLGAKIFHTFSIILLLLAIFKLLQKRLNKQLSFFFCLLPLSSVVFISRIGIQKATGIAVAYSIFYYYILFSQKYWKIILASFIYVYLYGGWPLLLVFNVLYSISLIIYNKSFVKALKVFISALVGVLLALILNPAFPLNLEFYWQQIYKIALVNDVSLGFVASEWLPITDIKVFILFVTIPFLLFILNLIFSILNKSKISRETFTFIILSFLFFILTLKSRRYIEYFVPFTIITSGFIYGDLKLFKYLFKTQVQKVLIIITVLLLSLYGFTTQWILISQDNSPEYFGYTNYEQSSNWVKQNIKQGEVIFHTLWEEFPMLFYYNDKNYYISGLDPRFLLYKDQKRAQKYYDLVLQSKKLTEQEIYTIINKDYNSNFILINYKVKRNQELEAKLANSKLFELVYFDNFIHIYKL